MSSPENSENLSPAAQAFAEFVEQSLDESGDFEAFCAARPELAPDLRRLHARWRRLEDAFEELETSGGASRGNQVSLDESTAETLADLGRDRSLAMRYAMRDEIARGGMARVMTVWDKHLRRELAMKALLRDDDDPRYVSRFLEEAQITGQLDHPGIVPVHELGVDSDGQVFFTMPLIRGRDLGAVFQLVESGEDGWTRTRVLGVILRVCEAVAFAHSKGVIHRDLKPANVMVGRFGETYVMDWGLARVAGSTDTRDLRLAPASPREKSVTSLRRDVAEHEPDSPLMTMDGEIVGTPVYMAPEQARGEAERIGPRTDVYAIGTILYELLAGRKPFVEPGVKMTQRTVLARLLDGPPRPLAELDRDVPAELEAICERAMAREAEDRYADVSELREDLRAYLDGRVVRAYRTGSAAELRKWVQRNRGLTAASIIAVLALVVGLGLSTALFLDARDSSQRLLRLADAKRLEQLRAQGDELWPADPERRSDYRQWLADASELVGRLEHLHAGTLEEMRSNAVAGGAEEREWTFATTEEEWEHDRLSELVEDLRAFADPETGMVADVERRLAFAETIEERSMSGANVARSWRGAADAIAASDGVRASARYGGLEVAPQLGLVPTGMDPGSKLWEFLHLGSHVGDELPERDPATGRLVMTGDTGIVFVLVPGGVYRLGAQSHDPGAPGYDELADGDESPVHQVSLEPFLLSKYEMTQGQWKRLSSGETPAYFRAETNPGGLAPITWSNPVERVGWADCDALLRRYGLVLPTEAQWESACRAGSETPWHSGARVESLAGFANLADQAAKENTRWPATEDWLADGHVTHAPVGSFEPNGFGLHDMSGNVWEWCRDRFCSYAITPRPGDGLRDDPTAKQRLDRGGSYYDVGFRARSSYRSKVASTTTSQNAGVRPARRLR